MNPSGDRPLRWRAAPRDDLLWAEFDGDYVLYHRSSGQTHFLNAASALLLRDALVRPADLDAACAALDAAQRPVDADRSPQLKATQPEAPSWAEPERREYLLGLLARFEELGLVARVPG